jgi:hypothetical protein
VRAAGEREGAAGVSAGVAGVAGARRAGAGVASRAAGRGRVRRAAGGPGWPPGTFSCAARET